VEFSIADLSAHTGEGIGDDSFWESGGADRANAQPAGAQSKAAKAEGGAAASGAEGEEFEDPEPSYPARVTVTISKVCFKVLVVFYRRKRR
jgi:hypothetical protein